MRFSGLDDLQQLKKSPLRGNGLKIGPTKSYGGLRFRTCEDVKPKAIQWLWKGMIPKGKITLFAGDSGIGKTQILLSIAAKITQGGHFAGEETHCKQGDVIYLSGEDDLSDTLIPRFIASGGIQARLHDLSPTRLDGSAYSLAEELENIQEYLFDNPDISLFIIDPITAFCGGNFDNNDVTSVRSLATRIKQLAEDTGVAVIILNHLTKDSKNQAVHRILGSGAWVHAPRTVLGACKSDGNYYFGKWKANISDDGPVYKYDMVSREVEGLEAYYIRWSEDVLRHNVLKDFEDIGVTTKGDKSAIAQEILEYELEDGLKHRKKDLIKAVQQEVKISKRQIERIAEEMHLQQTRENKQNGEALWQLPLTTDGE
jgi:putative DNA primase/helicase